MEQNYKKIIDTLLSSKENEWKESHSLKIKVWEKTFIEGSNSHPAYKKRSYYNIWDINLKIIVEEADTQEEKTVYIEYNSTIVEKCDAKISGNNIVVNSENQNVGEKIKTLIKDSAINISWK